MAPVLYQCTVCLNHYKIKPDGKLYRHGGKVKGQECPGSFKAADQPPAGSSASARPPLTAAPVINPHVATRGSSASVSESPSQVDFFHVFDRLTVVLRTAHLYDHFPKPCRDKVSKALSALLTAVCDDPATRPIGAGSNIFSHLFCSSPPGAVAGLFKPITLLNGWPNSVRPRSRLLWQASTLSTTPNRVSTIQTEPSGIAVHDGKRPDGCTLIPWRAGKCLAWDVTVPGTFAERYVQLTSKESGLAATRASDEKIKKYDGALPSMEFLPICIEVLGPMDRNTSGFFNRICKHITIRSGDSKEYFFAMNNISCILQRFLRVCVLENVELNADGVE
ncbi:hypothetical protein HELRODRAFT_163789 [Helobdella robusta]|uniref:Uncharacterized protein n=1 Tax=Helobdella robusta TaxID=6412 RepID=T1EUH2_HELRO|nr:hypothetical protein HELRODRAFT_163789 [Helobdella robusta]ESN96693.1 hypothetical protein HELRODRAFT_163789 [Helobdella robusta]